MRSWLLPRIRSWPITQIWGMVTLVCFRPKQDSFFVLSLGVVLGLIVFLAVSALLGGVPRTIADTRLAATLLAGGAVFLPMPFIFSVLANLSNRMARRSDRFAADLRLTAKTAVHLKLLILRSAWDEASMGIAFFQTMSWVSRRAFQWILRISRMHPLGAFMRKPRFLRSLAVGLISAYIAEYSLFGTHRVLIATLVSTFGPVAFGGVAFLLLIVPLAVPLAAFGSEMILFAPWLDLTVEVTPPGTWPIHNVSPLFRSVDAWNHQSYDHSETLTELLIWLEERTGFTSKPLVSWSY